MNSYAPTNNFLKDVFSLENLKDVILVNCSLIDTITDVIENPVNFEILDLSFNFLEGKIDIFGNNMFFPKLKFLFLANNILETSDLTPLFQSNTLEAMYIFIIFIYKE